MKEKIEKALEIVTKHNLQSYVEILLEFWSKEPPTLGHGFCHVVEVAVNSYEFGVANNYEKPEDLFIGGLFHDIHSPAEGTDGEEDQTKGAEIVKELFQKNNVDLVITEKVISMIMSHDSWRGQENVPQYDLILSIGDKASHKPLYTNSYVWASNKYYVEKTGKRRYTSHLITLYAFQKYQQRAWEIFVKHPIKGTEKAIEAYLNIYNKTAEKYLEDPKGEFFEDYINQIADEYRGTEEEFLKAFTKDENLIKGVMRLCY